MARKPPSDETLDNAQDASQAASASIERAMEPLQRGASRSAMLCRRWVEWTQQVQMSQLEMLRTCSALLIDATAQMDHAPSRDALGQTSAQIWRGLLQQSRQAQDTVFGLTTDLRGDLVRMLRDQADDARESLQAIARLSGGSTTGPAVFDPLASMAQARASLDQWIARWNVPFAADASRLTETSASGN